MATSQDQKTAEKETSQVQAQKAAEKEDEAETKAELSNEVKVYYKCYDAMFLKLINSLPKFSDLAMQCGLLSDATQAAVTDLTYVHSQEERTGILLRMLTQKMDKKMGAAPIVMKGFMDATLDVLGEQVHDFLKTEQAQGKSEKLVITTNRARLVGVLQNNLIPFATKLKSAFILEDAEYSMICNPKAKQKELNMQQVLSEIGESIKAKPNKNLQKFIEEVIEELGPYAEDIATELRKGLTDPQLDPT